MKGSGKRKLKSTVLVLTVAALLSGCSMPTFQNPETKTESISKVSDITQLPTFTPTPAEYKEPTVTDVTGDAASIHPLFSGAFEDIWLTAEEVPIEKVLKDGDATTAAFRILWSESMLFVQVHVLDDSPDTANGDINRQDAVWFFINESGELPQKYAVGDACYTINREGLVTAGTGANLNDLISVVYEDGEQGYYVEAGIPLETVSAKSGTTIGFDIRVNNARGEKLRTSLQFADKSGYTEYTLQGVSLLTLE